MKKILLKVLIWLCGLLLIGGPVAIVLMGNIDGIMTQRFLVIDWEGAAIHACFTLLFLLPAIIFIRRSSRSILGWSINQFTICK